MSFKNPVISGAHPDPSICRVGDDYYLCNSTFAYYPGAPIFHSKDLVNWRLIGHALKCPSQLPLEGVAAQNGMYAPTLRHINGRFYMITTLVHHPTMGSQHLYVWADNPAGEWSDPIWINQRGIDPDLFQDDDGKVYFVRNNFGEGDPRGIVAAEIDLETGEMLSEMKFLWTGTGGYEPEGPHLYKFGEWYYLMLAENGTYYGHMETIGRSKDLWGPYESCPHNPILTHRDVTPHSIKCTGHADIIQDHQGDWWMIFLGVRPPNGWVDYQHLGRETFLTPITWENGWPVVNQGKPVELEMDVPTLTLVPQPSVPERDDFDRDTLDSHWLTLRQPDKNCFSLTERPGYLRIKGNENSLDDEGSSPALLARWQTEMNCRVKTCLEFSPANDNEEGGLATFMRESHHYEIAVTQRNQKRVVLLRRRIDDLQKVVAEHEIGEGPITLICEATPVLFTFSYGVVDEKVRELGTGKIKPIGVEAAAVFTGMVFGLYATGNGKDASQPADFDYFDYEEQSKR